MGCYDRELDGFPLDGDELDDEDDLEGIDLLPYPRGLAELRLRHEVPIDCARCGAQRMVSLHDHVRIHETMTMWRRGWRRDPNTQLDYCPDCAPAVRGVTGTVVTNRDLGACPRRNVLLLGGVEVIRFPPRPHGTVAAGYGYSRPPLISRTPATSGMR